MTGANPDETVLRLRNAIPALQFLAQCSDLVFLLTRIRLLLAF